VPLLVSLAKELLGTVMERWSVQQWELLKEREERLDLLEEGALIVAQWGEPDVVDVAAVRAELASIVEEVATRTAPTASIRERIEAVNFLLFQQHGFRGNTGEYYNPHNSFIHRVLERKTGIPISLSIVWAAVARRLQVPCHLCAQFPCHIIIRVVSGAGTANDLYVDAFNRKIMDYSSLLAFSLELVGSPLQESWLEACPASMTYSRMLRNLHGIYQREAAPRQQACDAERRLALQRVVGVCVQMATITDDPGTAMELKNIIQTLQKDLGRVPYQ